MSFNCIGKLVATMASIVLEGALYGLTVSKLSVSKRLG